MAWRACRTSILSCPISFHGLAAALPWQNRCPQRHVAALEASSVALLEAQELAAAGQMFFQWAGSVVEEEARSRPRGSSGAAAQQRGPAQRQQADSPEAASVGAVPAQVRPQGRL